MFNRLFFSVLKVENNRCMGEKIIVILSDFFKHSAYVWSKNEGVRRPIFVVSY